jgi:CHAT domain
LRLDAPTTQITNVSRREFFEECYEAAENLRTHLNRWLNSEKFRPVKERMLEKLHPNESIRIILQTENSQLRRLPWVLWNLCDRYPKAEIALSSPTYDRILQSKSPKAKIKILAILGNRTGINLSQDQYLLEKLPDANVTFLVEPQRQELNDQLWAQPWNILFFAGHSFTQINTEVGQIHINQRDTLTIAELKNALKKAIAEGLQLAIFNSCDGLGLAVNLADLHIPQMIVMREPIPDTVAQEFLKNFLTAFANRKSLYQSVREARERLQGLEDRFPCATWLPVIFQNPAEVPPTWEGLKGGD